VENQQKGKFISPVRINLKKTDGYPFPQEDFMPAINLPRLKIQTAKLMDRFGKPDEFIRELHNLFDAYADLTMRKGALVSPISTLPSYRVPLPVIRHLELELGSRAQRYPDHALVIADRLWEDEFYETRMLAAYLLGRMTPGGNPFLERLTKWVAETREPAISNLLLTTSLARMRSETPDDFLLLMGRWTHQPRKKMWGSVLIALVPLLKDRNFNNLPPIYSIVQPIIESAPATLQQELAAFICGLFDASPVETTYFLRQLITLSARSHTVQNIRRIMPSLPVTLQDEMREAIRKQG